MAWRLAESLITLRNQVNIAWPNRNKASDGTIGDAAHQNTVSDHNPNRAGVVCALDLTHDPANGLDIGKLGEALAASRDNRIKYLIADRRILIPSAGWYWQAYYGSNPHTSHIHISVGGNYDDKRNWSIDGGGAPPTPVPTNVKGVVTVTVDKLYVRTAPTLSAPLSGSRELSKGTPVGYTAVVVGQAVNGNNIWLRSIHGNFYWSGGTNFVHAAPVSGWAEVTAQVLYVRSAPTTAASLSGSRQLVRGNRFQFVAKVTGQNVAGNPTWYRSAFGNFIWSGGAKDI